MNKYLKLAILVLAFVTSAISAQSLDFIRTSPEYVSVNPLDSFVDNISYGHLINHLSPGDSIRIFVLQNNLPAGWQVALCDVHNCYPPDVDSITAIEPQDTSEISIHFYDYVQTHGSGTVTIRVESRSNPSIHKDQTFGGTTEPI